MGRIYDVLRRAEQERRGQVAGAGKPEPAVVLDLPEPVRSELVEPTFDVATGPAEPSAASGALPVGELSTTPEVCPLPELVCVAAPSSPAAEHLRTIRSRLLGVFKEHGYRSLLVTSPGRGDGKTLTASNLALLLAAEIGRRVLLVDGDLRKPAVHRLFGVTQAPGLSDVALGRVGWTNVVVQAPWNGLSVVPAGTPVGSTAELLNGPAAREFFQEARAAFDFVVIDAPPVLPVADAMVLADLADAVLLVARTERTPRQAILDALDALAGTTLLGVVLNALPTRSLVNRSYYSY
jgi:capsular exopolysaccharide synthesis family protein